MAVDGADRSAPVDALRAIAALLVVWMHVAQIYTGVRESGPVWSLTWEIADRVELGRAGVLIFFLISGFLIPSSLRGDRIGGLRNFAIRRFFRLYPLYWLSIPLSVVTMWWLMNVEISSREIALNFTMIQELFGARNASGLYWTLRVELYFYALCMVLFLLGRLSDEKTLIAASLGALTTHALYQFAINHRVSIAALFTNELSFIAMMFAGAVWRLHLDGRATRVGRLFVRAVIVLFTVIFPLIALATLMRRGHILPGESKMLFSYVIAVAVFAAGMTVARISWKPLAWIGRISYSIYLLHPIILYAVFWYIVRLPGDSILRNLPVFVYVIAISALTILVSQVTYQFIEAPMMRLGKWLTSSRRRGPKTAELAAM